MARKQRDDLKRDIGDIGVGLDRQSPEGVDAREDEQGQQRQDNGAMAQRIEVMFTHHDLWRRLRGRFH